MRHLIVESGVKEITPKQAEHLLGKGMIYLCDAVHEIEGCFDLDVTVYHIPSNQTWGNVNAVLMEVQP